MGRETTGKMGSRVERLARVRVFIVRWVEPAACWTFGPWMGQGILVTGQN